MNSKTYLDELLSSAGCKNANETSEGLIDKLGNLYTVIQTDGYKLVNMGFDDKAISVIRLAAELTLRRISDRFRSGKKYSDEEIRELIAGLLFTYTVEAVYMLTFDGDGKFIAADRIDAGTVNSSGVIPRKILDTVLRRRGKGVILAHNHPCGRPVPSQNDVMTTLSVASVCKSAGITLYAHYVVAGFEMYDCMSDIGDGGAEERILKVSSEINRKI